MFLRTGALRSCGRVAAPRIAMAVAVRPICCSGALQCGGRSVVPAPWAPVPLPAAPRLPSRSEQEEAGTVPAFEVRTPLDVLRLLTRALYLGALLLPPLLLLLPSLLLPGRQWLWHRFEAEVLRTLERGGPCLIKLGQWASTRPDLLPLSTCRTLASLHDAVPAHSLAETHGAIEAAFGAPVSALFARVGARPVGSGCIAQVHEAETASGVRVAIKVLHPNVERLVAMDLCLLRAATRLVEAVVPLRGLRWLALTESVDAFAAFMASQLDLRREARNLERFRANFGNDDGGGGRGGGVRFPRPLREEGLVANTVLVETFVEGEALTQLLKATRRRRAAAARARAAAAKAAAEGEEQGGDRCDDDSTDLADGDEGGQLGLGAARDAELARRGLDAFFTMVLKHNFVHADLHPGNILVAPPPSSGGSGGSGGSGEGRGAEEAPLGVSFVDAGLAVELSARDQANFKRLFRALGAGDGRRAARLMLEHATHHECVDPEGFEEGVERIVRGVGLGARGAFNLKALKIGDVLLELTTLVRLHRVKIEPNFTTLVMAIVVLEGLGRQLDPTLDLFAVALPMLF